MEILNFIASIVNSIVWPAIILVIILILRKSISQAILGISKFQYKDLKIDFGKELAEVKSASNLVDVPSDKDNERSGASVSG